MAWHCKSCNRTFIRNPKTKQSTEIIDGTPKILFCPYCNSEKIENIYDSKNRITEIELFYEDFGNQ